VAARRHHQGVAARTGAIAAVTWVRSRTIGASLPRAGWQSILPPLSVERNAPAPKRRRGAPIQGIRKSYVSGRACEWSADGCGGNVTVAFPLQHPRVQCKVTRKPTKLECCPSLYRERIKNPESKSAFARFRRNGHGHRTRVARSINPVARVMSFHWIGTPPTSVAVVPLQCRFVA